MAKTVGQLIREAMAARAADLGTLYSFRDLSEDVLRLSGTNYHRTYLAKVAGDKRVPRGLYADRGHRTRGRITLLEDLTAALRPHFNREEAYAAWGLLPPSLHEGTLDRVDLERARMLAEQMAEDLDRSRTLENPEQFRELEGGFRSALRDMDRIFNRVLGRKPPRGGSGPAPEASSGGAPPGGDSA